MYLFSMKKIIILNLAVVLLLLAEFVFMNPFFNTNVHNELFCDIRANEKIDYEIKYVKLIEDRHTWKGYRALEKYQYIRDPENEFICALNDSIISSVPALKANVLLRFIKQSEILYSYKGDTETANMDKKQLIDDAYSLFCRLYIFKLKDAFYLVTYDISYGDFDFKYRIPTKRFLSMYTIDNPEIIEKLPKYNCKYAVEDLDMLYNSIQAKMSWYMPYIINIALYITIAADIVFVIKVFVNKRKKR